MNQPYLAFLLLLGFVAFNAALLIGLSHLLAPHKPSAIKDSPYESGMPPLGTTRERFAPPRDVSPGRCFATRLSDKAGQTVKRVIETKEVSGQSPNYLLAKFQDLVDWAVNSSRANSLWPMPFGTACCAIEFMATAASRYDFARFGMERQAFSPRQADVLICAGRLPFKLAPVIRRIYDQMPQPKWVISMGACASTGGIFDNYAMVQGIDTIVPVDVYVPGCPPRPEGLLYGVLLLHKKIKGESLFDRVPRREEQLLDERGLRLPPEQIDEISEPFGNSVHQFRTARRSR